MFNWLFDPTRNFIQLDIPHVAHIRLEAIGLVVLIAAVLMAFLVSRHTGG